MRNITHWSRLQWMLVVAFAVLHPVEHASGAPDLTSDAPRSVPFAESAAAAQLSADQIGDRVAYQILRKRDFVPWYTDDIQLEALLAWGQASAQPGYVEFVRQASRDRKFSPGYDLHSYRLQVFSSLTFKLYECFGRSEYVEPFLNETRKYQAEALRAQDGVISYYFPQFAAASVPGVGVLYLEPKFTPVLIDNTQEYASRLAKAGALSKDPAFYRESADQFMKLRHALRDPATGLWSHGRGWYTSGQTVTTTKWGRAQGWILRGLVESLSYLPRGSREHQQVAAMLTESAESLLRYQDSQGFWHQVADRPDSYQETSSTAFISYYLARAVREGLLPERPYKQASATAFEALAREKISADGVVYGTSEMTPPLQTTEMYLGRRTPLNDPHGVATVLLSATGQLLLAEKGAIPMTTDARRGAHR